MYKIIITEINKENFVICYENNEENQRLIDINPIILICKEL